MFWVGVHTCTCMCWVRQLLWEKGGFEKRASDSRLASDVMRTLGVISGTVSGVEVNARADPDVPNDSERGTPVGTPVVTKPLSCRSLCAEDGGCRVLLYL